MNSTLQILELLNLTIEYYREILNSLLLYYEPTSEVVITASQQLDKYLNDYTNAIVNNNCKYIA
ncbi:aspartyl-phosphate phosphatase Spo0E family protein [Clostridium sp. ZS2-4]|uniref:aspartyl-phosphate phosphatase Spo0E family protein n=1 Tax=Clostridium sp. ZS2-4 TaxID=2987703 RepID=UPI00227AF293|nr:aspartyl-phosphate phosphatase Spo0E family protein [Clostridium sp. ZS2-4]MCY6356488.1 aspartyl-phosphate phosphatase Spo0E family protein [Clostridium sp. ZS2-4]